MYFFLVCTYSFRGNLRVTSHFRHINVTFDDVTYGKNPRDVTTYYVFKYWIAAGGSGGAISERWLSVSNTLSGSAGGGDEKRRAHVYYAFEEKPHHTISGLLIDEVITLQVARVNILVGDGGDPNLLFILPTDAKEYSPPVNLSTRPSYLAKVSGMYLFSFIFFRPYLLQKIQESEQKLNKVFFS